MKIKGKKAVAIFSYLIVISALILFNYAFIKFLFVEKAKAIESLDYLYVPVDFKWHLKQVNDFLDTSYNLAFSNTLNGFLNAFDNSEECRVIERNGKKFFSIRSCSVKKEIFLEMFKKNFESYVKSYVAASKIYFNTTPYYFCEYNSRISCVFDFKRKFQLGLINITVNREFVFEKEIDLSLIKKLEEIKNKLFEMLESGEKIREIDGFNVDVQETENIVYISLNVTESFYEKKGTLEYSYLSLNLFYRKNQ